MLRLEHPLLALLLLLVPALIYLAHYRTRRGGKLPFSFAIWGDGAFAAGGAAYVLLVAARVLFWVGLAALLLAIAGPVTVRKQRTYLSRGLDMIICLDVSPSMAARDSGAVSRFQAAREVVRSFATGRTADALGLVAFGREAALRVPPTLDHRYFFRTLDALKVLELGDGTAIGNGVAVAALHLQGSRSREKVIVLLTDGDNNAGDVSPEQAATLAARLGIRLYTIGIGAEGETTLEFQDPETGKQYRGVYQGRFNAGLLKEIASQTGGRYFHSGSLGILNAIFQEIDVLEKSDSQVTVYVERLPRHRGFVLAGLLAILAGVAISRFLLGEVP